MNNTRSLEVARDALAALEARRDELLASVEGARTAVSDAEIDRDELISRAAVGDKKATREIIRRADDAWRDAQLALKIEEAKVKAIEADIAAAEIKVMRAKAQALSENLRNAMQAEVSAYQSFLGKIREAQSALELFHQASTERFMAYNQAHQHNESKAVLKVAYPNRPEKDVWQPPRPVTITIEGSMISTARDMSAETIEMASEAEAKREDPSVLVSLQGAPASISLGTVCTGHVFTGGWKVRSIAELASLGEIYAARAATSDEA